MNTKRKNEYVFKDDYMPKRWWQWVMYALGFWPSLDEHERLIDRPSCADLKILPEKAMQSLAGEISNNKLQSMILISLLNANLTKHGLHNMLIAMNTFELDDINLTMVICEKFKDAELIFYDGSYFSLSPKGHSIAQRVKRIREI